MTRPAVRIFPLAICLVTAIACGGGSSPTTPTPPSNQTPPPNPAPNPGPVAGTWVSEGTRFTNSTMGITGTMADSTTLRLNDGRWRMFIFAGQGYRSAISTDGLSFTMEDGNRL